MNKEKEYLILSNLGSGMRILDKEIEKDKDGKFDYKKLLKCRKGENVIVFTEVRPNDEIAVVYNKNVETPMIKVKDIPLLKPGGAGTKVVKVSLSSGEVIGAGFIE